MGVLRFVVRAWVRPSCSSHTPSILVFTHPGDMSFARRATTLAADSLPPAEALAYAFFRVLGRRALSGTFHPWSPFSVYSSTGGWDGGYEALAATSPAKLPVRAIPFTAREPLLLRPAVPTLSGRYTRETSDTSRGPSVGNGAGSYLPASCGRRVAARRGRSDDVPADARLRMRRSAEAKTALSLLPSPP